VRYGADCTVLAGENRRLAPHAARRFERTQATLAGRDRAALQLVGMEQAFTPACKHSLQAFKPARGMPRKLALFRPASTACSRSSRRAACRASLPYSGLQAQLAGVQAGARHAVQACPIPACKHSLQAFKPARGMPRKLALIRPASTACRRSSRRAACRASLPAFTPHKRTLYPVQLRFLAACRTLRVRCVVWRNGWMQGAARSQWLFHWQESQRCRRRCDAQPEGAGRPFGIAQTQK